MEIFNLYSLVDVFIEKMKKARVLLRRILLGGIRAFYPTGIVLGVGDISTF